MFERVDDFSRALRGPLAALASITLIAAGGSARAASVSEEGGWLVFHSESLVGETADLRGGERRYEIRVDADTGAKQLAPSYAPLVIDVDGEVPEELMLGWLGAFFGGLAWTHDFVVEQDGELYAYFGGYVSAARFRRDAEGSPGLELTLGFEDVQAIGSADGFATEAEAAEKKWTPAAFEVEIAGLPGSHPMELEWEDTGSNEAVEFPKLELTMSSADYDEWNDWLETFETSAEASGSETSGFITWLSPDHSSSLSLDMQGLEIFKIDLPPGEALVVVELYLQHAEIAIETVELAHEGFQRAR